MNTSIPRRGDPDSGRSAVCPNPNPSPDRVGLALSFCLLQTRGVSHGVSMGSGDPDKPGPFYLGPPVSDPQPCPAQIGA